MNWKELLKISKTKKHFHCNHLIKIIYMVMVKSMSIKTAVLYKTNLKSMPMRIYIQLDTIRGNRSMYRVKRSYPHPINDSHTSADHDLLQTTPIQLYQAV